MSGSSEVWRWLCLGALASTREDFSGLSRGSAASRCHVRAGQGSYANDPPPAPLEWPLPGLAQSEFRSGCYATNRFCRCRTDCSEGGRRRSAHASHEARPGDKLEVVEIHDRRLANAIGLGQAHLGVQATHRRSDRADDHRMQHPPQGIPGEHDHRAALVQLSQPDFASPDRWRVQLSSGHSASQSVSSARSFQSGRV